jgi:hypothetical protein
MVCPLTTIERMCYCIKQARRPHPLGRRAPRTHHRTGAACCEHLALLVTGQRQGATGVCLGTARPVDGPLETALGKPWFPRAVKRRSRRRKQLRGSRSESPGFKRGSLKFASEGPAQPAGRLRASRCGVVSSKQPLLLAHGTQGQGAFVLFPTGTTYRRTPQIRLSWQGAQCPTQHSCTERRSRQRERAIHPHAYRQGPSDS